MDATTPLPPTDDRPPYPPPPIGPRRLTRSADDRMISGVCGGVAEYLRVDPTVVRLVAIVLAFFGVGLVAYLVGWALIPEASNAPRSKPASDWLVPAGLLLLLLLFGGFGVFDRDFELPAVALVLLGVGAVLVWGGRRDDRAGRGPAPGPGPGPAPGPGASPASGPGLATTAPLPAETAPLPPPPPEPPPPTVTGPPAPPPPPASARRRGRFPWRSVAIAIGGMFIAAGAFSAAVVLSDNVAPTVVLGATLAALGVVMIVGAWLGRTRPLVPAGLLLLLGLATVAIIDVPLEGGFADRVIVPETVDDIPTEERLTAGRLLFDLRDVDLSGDEAFLEASVAAGELIVIVPVGSTVEVRAEVGVGDLEVLGRETSGMGPEITQVVEGAGEGRIELDVQVGAGHLEVRRG